MKPPGSPRGPPCADAGRRAGPKAAARRIAPAHPARPRPVLDPRRSRLAWPPAPRQAPAPESDSAAAVARRESSPPTAPKNRLDWLSREAMTMPRFRLFAGCAGTVAAAGCAEVKDLADAWDVPYPGPRHASRRRRGRRCRPAGRRRPRRTSTGQCADAHRGFRGRPRQRRRPSDDAAAPEERWHPDDAPAPDDAPTSDDTGGRTRESTRAPSTRGPPTRAPRRSAWIRAPGAGDGECDDGGRARCGTSAPTVPTAPTADTCTACGAR